MTIAAVEIITKLSSIPKKTAPFSLAAGSDNYRDEIERGQTRCHDRALGIRNGLVALCYPRAVEAIVGAARSMDLDRHRLFLERQIDRASGPLASNPGVSANRASILWSPCSKNAPEWIEIGPKETKYDRWVLFLLTSPAFLLDSETPNIAISRSANYYERCPQYNEHPPRLSSLWNMHAQCCSVSRRSMWRILNFTLNSEARRMNCFDQADQKLQRLRWRRHYYL